MSTKTAKSSAREIALAKEFAKYENKWVAIVVDGKSERVVASGDRITDAKAAADKIGIKDPTFMKIPSRGETFIARLLRPHFLTSRLATADYHLPLIRVNQRIACI